MKQRGPEVIPKRQGALTKWKLQKYFKAMEVVFAKKGISESYTEKHHSFYDINPDFSGTVWPLRSLIFILIHIRGNKQKSRMFFKTRKEWIRSCDNYLWKTFWRRGWDTQKIFGHWFFFPLGIFFSFCKHVVLIPVTWRETKPKTKQKGISALRKV